jgi:type I restriction enzyme R subunit
MINSHSNLAEEREDIKAYLEANQEKLKTNSFTDREISEDYQKFKTQKAAEDLAKIAKKHGLKNTSLQAFVDDIMSRMIFDGELLTDLLAPLQLNWKARRTAELGLMEDLVPYLQKLAGGRDISGLNAYE